MPAASPTPPPAATPAALSTPGAPSGTAAHTFATVPTSTPHTPAARRRRAARARLVLLVLGGASLLAGLNAALMLVGVWAPVPAAHLPGLHGVVMVLGFLGTLISLERAQALGKSWGYLAPAVLAGGSFALVLGAPPAAGALLLIQGCVLFVGVYLALWRRSRSPIVAVQALSAVFALCAAALWLVIPVEHLLAWLAGFIVLTIAAERTELALLTMGPRAPHLLVALSAALTAGAVAAMAWPDVGHRIFGAVTLTFALWLARDDIARRFIRSEGLRRYNAAALLAGYGWLALAGTTWLVGGAPDTQARYDVTIHATFLGFAVSMVMAHAPLIFPAVLGRPLPYRPISWLPLVLLHVGLAVRVAGDAAASTPLWRAGSILTVAAVVVFALVSFLLVVTARANPR